MSSYTIIRKDGKRFNVSTPDDGGRYQIRSGGGYGVRGSPTVYKNTSSGKRRVDNEKSSGVKVQQSVKALSEKPSEQKTVSLEVQPKTNINKNTVTPNMSVAQVEQFQRLQNVKNSQRPEQVSDQASGVVDNRLYRNFNNNNSYNSFERGIGRLSDKVVDFQKRQDAQWAQVQSVYPYDPLPRLARAFGELTRLPADASLWLLDNKNVAKKKIPEFFESTVPNNYNNLIKPVNLLNSGVTASQLTTVPNLGFKAGKEFAPYAEAYAKGLAEYYAQNPARIAYDVVTAKLLWDAPRRAKNFMVAKGRSKVDFSDLTRPEIAESVGKPNLPRSIQYPYFGETPKEAVDLVKGGSPSVRKVQQLFYGDDVFDLTKGSKPDPIVFSSSPSPLLGNKVLSNVERKALGIDRSETQIMSTIPYVAPTYLEVGAGGSSSFRIGTPKTFIEELKKKPTIYGVVVEDVKRPSSNVRKVGQSMKYESRYKLFEEDLLKNQKQGDLFTAPTFEAGKPEIEFALGAGQQFVKTSPRTGKQFYTSVNGRNVPLDFIDTRQFAVDKLTKSSPALVPFDDIFKSSKDFSSVASNSKTVYLSNSPTASFLDSVRQSFKPSEFGGSSNIYDSSNLMVLNPSTQNPSVVPSSNTVFASLKPSVVVPSSGGKNIFSNTSSGVLDFSVVRPPPSSSGNSGGRSGGSSSKPPNSIKPPSIVPSSPNPSTPSRGGGSSSSFGGGSSIGSPLIRGGSSYAPFGNYQPPPPPKYPSIFSGRKNDNAMGFDVFVRRKGRFVKANPKPLTKSGAINFGTFKVGSDSSATFKLKSASSSGVEFFRKGNLKNFYRKGDLFIEKKEKRIKRSSPLELAQITYKGIASIKSKSKLKNIFGGGL